MKRPSERLGIVVLVVMLLSGNGALRAAYSAWGEDRPMGAFSLIQEGPWRVNEDRVYRNQVQLSIVGGLNDPFFQVEMAAPTALSVRIKVTSYGTNFVFATSSETEFAATYDGVGTFVIATPFSYQGSTLVLDLDTGLNPGSFNFGLLGTPTGHNRLLVQIDAMASRPVTFVELW